MVSSVVIVIILSNCFILFYFVLFYLTLFYSILFYWKLLKFDMI